MEITKHLGYSEDPFELAFCKKKKKAHKSESNKDELELIMNFQKLRIIDTFEHGKEKQQQKTILTPNLKRLLQQSPLPESVLDEDGKIDFDGIINTDPAISEEIAEEIQKDINKDNELNQSHIDDSTHRVVGVFEGVVDQVPLNKLLPNEEEDSFFPDDYDDMDQLINVKSMATRNYILTSSNDESSDPNSNSENDGAYPSDNDSDKNFSHSDFDDDD